MKFGDIRLRIAAWIAGGEYEITRKGKPKLEVSHEEPKYIPVDPNFKIPEWLTDSSLHRGIPIMEEKKITPFDPGYCLTTPVDFSAMKGLTIESVLIAPDKRCIIFKSLEDGSFKLHDQEEEHSPGSADVYVEDICGDIEDIIGTPLLLVEEVSYENEHPPGCPSIEDECWTWTFYKIATNKGVVTIRWYGQSSKYYSQEVTLGRMLI